MKDQFGGVDRNAFIGVCENLVKNLRKHLTAVNTNSGFCTKYELKFSNTYAQQ